ncbi:MAG: SPFH domain-containing protein [Propionibacteriaceae bacterium]|jgi:regulator of protease activity HflC (stomatin/prohibitin superfamily)|nr:SPFH domain-containing protein [Propionibacteriaceae bacterium]
MTQLTNQRPAVEECTAKAIAGMPMLLLGILMMLGPVGVAVPLGIRFHGEGNIFLMTVVIVAASVVHVLSYFVLAGLRVLQPNEAFVLTLFGRYVGTLRGPGFFFVNPFSVAAAPQASSTTAVTAEGKSVEQSFTEKSLADAKRKRLSLKVRTLNNQKMKINDEMGNPIEIGIVVMWQVVNTAKAIFSVDDYESYISIQSDAALRNVVRLYPYDAPEGKMSLKGSSQEVADEIQAAIQEKVHVAGVEILEARITHLAYAPEIAAAMLQRQQASAVVDARSLIVKGAVGMVREALDQLNEEGIVELDEERKAAMVSNLLVVLCANRDTQPIVNSGSLY